MLPWQPLRQEVDAVGEVVGSQHPEVAADEAVAPWNTSGALEALTSVYSSTASAI